MAKLFGCPINVEAEEEEEDGGGISISVDISRSVNQPDGEATSSSAGLPQSDQREETYPCFGFLDSNSDSESLSMESESDPNNLFFDFFDREPFASSNQRPSTSCDFDICGGQDMEEEIELGLGIGSGSGSGSDDSGGLAWLQVTEVETDRVEVETGRVEVDTGRAEVVSGPTLVEAEARSDVDEQTMDRWFSELMEGTSLSVEPMDVNQEDEPMDLEWHISSFDDFLDFDHPPLEVSVTSIYGYADHHGDYEDVLARSFDESGTKGSPPASKGVVDELPDVEITSGELMGIGCAICKDEIVVAEEKVTRLPCKHYYHKECIVPWLGIRNTCPVCRYELPTDDLEYERKRRSQRGLARDLMSE